MIAKVRLVVPLGGRKRVILGRGIQGLLKW